MDLSVSHQQASSSSLPTATSSNLQSTRSSARVKAAREKETAEASTSDSVSSNTRSTRRPRDTKGKDKEIIDESSVRASKRLRRSTLPASNSALTINEPIRDIKGKKRAAPEANSEEDESGPSVKRTRSTYSLRSRTTQSDMPRKTKSTLKGKGVTVRAKALAVAGSSRTEEDVEMLGVECGTGEDVDEDVEDDEEHDEDEGHADGGNGGEGDDAAEPAPTSAGRTDESSTTIGMFGDYRQLGSYMMSLSSRLKTMLSNIKATADPTTRLITLQELSELLSISTEDTLSGSFQVESFVKELVRILGGTGGEAANDDGDGDEDQHDEDAVLAAALAMSAGGGAYQGDENLEAQVLACRCLANLMEALPGCAHTVVYHGAVPVLCSKLIEISYIDLAEQTLSTLEKISEEFPSSIVREGGLAALLNYLDFFSIAVQRTALQAASNCCRNISPEHFPMIRGVWPIIRNCLAYSDQRLVEFACLCVTRVIDSYHRSSPDNLETLVDADLIRAVNMLLLPAGGSPLITSNTFTLFLRALATAARASPKIAVVLLEADIVDTLYQILAGVLPPTSNLGEEQGGGEGGQGLGGGLADMAVMQNLAHRPKDQVEEALSLISELMPPLPKDGVFDHKGYTEKSHARMVKAKAKADRSAARHAAAAATSAHLVAAGLMLPSTASGPATPSADDTSVGDAVMSEATTHDGEDSIPSASAREPAVDRKELLRSKPEVVGRFMHLIVPILVDVYAASVATHVRIRTLTGLLKAVSFLDGAELKEVLTYVPVASFAGSILSSRDHPSLVIGAIQLVELLLTKVPAEYKASFRREGVLHEIELLSDRAINNSTKTKDKDKDKESDAPTPAETGVPTPTPASVISAIPGYKKLTSLSLDPEDAITLRARVIRFKYLAGSVESNGADVFATLRRLVACILDVSATEKEFTDGLRDLADLFGSPHTSVSSFELLQSGVVDGLLEFATAERDDVSVTRRQEMLLEAFTSPRGKALNTGSVQTPFTTLVKKLQESLTRMESFEVITVAQGIDDSKRSSPSLLARQLRLRLVAAETSDMPRNLHNIVVSIHAIATFQALNDYLRPRVSGLLSGSSRLSGMLAALAASGQHVSRGLAASDAGLAVGSSGDPSQTNDDANATTAGTMSSTSTALSSSAPAQQEGRRRSLRLSAKASSSLDLVVGDGATEINATEVPSDEQQSAQPSVAHQSPPSTSVPEAAPSETLVNDDDEPNDDFMEDEIDAEMFDEEMDPDNSVSEKTITLAIAPDGTKVEAQTPDGTRIATPNPPKDAAQPDASSSSPPKPSYAAALKVKPADWHLEFSMDDHVLPLDLTIYGAIHQHEMRKATGSSLPQSMIWQGIYTVKFKKVSGPPPTPEVRSDGAEGTKSRSPSPTLASLPEDAPHAKILRLLRVLHKLNVRERELPVNIISQRSLPENAFINNKLTAKLTRQLEEPMIVASSCLPDWALDLPQHFPFLFPFATRYNFLQSTSFGYARLILKWQSQHNRVQDNSRRDDAFGFLGRLQRQKVRISRKHILESAVKVFELYGSSSSILEVEYFEEVGTGLGPTLEFYSLVSKEFARRDLKIWRDADTTMAGLYVHHPHGLFPAPLSHTDIANDGGQKRTHVLRVIGQFVAKAMLDSRIIDLSFNKVFLKLILGEQVPLTIATLKLVDVGLANSLARLEGYASEPVASDCEVASVEPMIRVEELALDFTIPGYDIELRPGGRDILVTSTNVHEYIAEVIDAIIGKGAQVQAKAFREGFSKVFPIADLQAFSADELVMLFGNGEEDWSTETLSESLKADHGFNIESRAIRDLVEIMSRYDLPARRNYLQFITGSPKLPIGGFRGLNPPLTVVRKPHEAPLTADDYLPSVMTCVNYLKLPEYTSRDVMREKLRMAMQEGVGSFHLS